MGCGDDPTAGEATFYVVGANALGNCTLEFGDTDFVAAVSPDLYAGSARCGMDAISILDGPRPVCKGAI